MLSIEGFFFFIYNLTYETTGSQNSEKSNSWPLEMAIGCLPRTIVPSSCPTSP